MQSWRTSTRIQYSSYIKKWLEYCRKWQINPVSPPLVASGLNVPAELYHKGLSYSALNTARSALASVIVLQGNQSFGNHPLVSCFLKGRFTTRPAVPKYREAWDVNTVLEHLKTLHPADFILKIVVIKNSYFDGPMVRPMLPDHSCFNYKGHENLKQQSNVYCKWFIKNY